MMPCQQRFWGSLGILLSLVGCASSSLEPMDDASRAAEAVNTSTVAIYFLSPLPAWANYSGRGGCFRESEVQFLDLASLGRSFNLTYPQRVEFHGIYNKLWRAYKNHYRVNVLPAQEQDKIFYQVLEKVRSGVDGINVPEHDRLNILWLDPLMANPAWAAAFARVQEEFVAQGHPILVSTCLDPDGLQQWQAKLGMAHEDVRFIDLGFFTSYQADGKRVAGEVIDSAALFPDKKVYLYLPRSLAGAVLPWENSTKLRTF